MTAASAPKRRALIVLGMHRSGTSALTGTLWRLGLDLGTNLMPPEEGSNSLGFYEHNSIVPIHEILLREMGSHWSSAEPFPADWLDGPAAGRARAAISDVLDHDFPPGGTEDWGMKDPRLCRFVRLWRPVLTDSEPCFILVRRDPAEVAASLAARDGMEHEAAARLWWRYMSEAERDTRGSRRLFVDYDELLSDWRKLISRIGDAFAVPGLPALAFDPAGPGAAEVERYLDPAERHHRARAESGRCALPDPVAAFDAALRQAVSGGGAAADTRFAALDRREAW